MRSVGLVPSDEYQLDILDPSLTVCAAATETGLSDYAIVDDGDMLLTSSSVILVTPSTILM
jgi:hypothetical protein